MIASVLRNGRTVWTPWVRASAAASTPDACIGVDSIRALNSGRSFRPKRRPDKRYRPITAKQKKVWDSSKGNPQKFVTLGEVENPKDELEADFGPLAASVVQEIQNERARKLGKHQIPYDDPIEESLRSIDYYLAEEGSIEDNVGQRRALAIEEPNEKAREKWMKKLNKSVKEQQLADMGLSSEQLKKEWMPKENEGTVPAMAELDADGEMDDDDEKDDPDVVFDPNQLAFGEWSEYLITVDRNIKLWRGGRLESYRALIVGGNMNGCGGFGVGKSGDAMAAVTKASKACKRNIFFVQRYQGNGLTRDLVGKHNNCKLHIRATDNGLRGNELCREILMRFGITNAACKAYGKRHTWNVVYATFKALMTHESLDEIAMKRGKRLVSLEKAMRLQI